MTLQENISSSRDSFRGSTDNVRTSRYSRKTPQTPDAAAPSPGETHSADSSFRQARGTPRHWGSFRYNKTSINLDS